ncbi:unnamed protein product [Prorocentrum cordatum]|uniref:P-type domain-containing protein n=1 Tax=Prorocentrum cordatum TaxID=2364126 RepID=A0ABN9V0H0_9DINO|nr:unnamed protein product [Polarella glacialis]
MVAPPMDGPDWVALALAATEGVIPVPWTHLLIACGVVVAESALAHFLEVGLADQLLVAGVRAFVQLNLLGYVLAPIFNSDSAPKVTYPNLFRDAVATTTLALFATGVVMMLIVMPSPWYDAHYLIPVDQVEVLLSFGANQWEAIWPGFTNIFRTALIPAINGMNVIGLVSIPGMMTGQILGGSPPETAARYQIVITFLISGSNFISVLCIMLLAVRSVFDARGRLDSERLTEQRRLNVAQLFSPAAWRKRRERRAGAAAGAEAAGRGVPLLEEAGRTAVELREVKAYAAPADEVLLDVGIDGLIGGSRRVAVSLELHPGEIAVVMGPSGVGKSTVLRLLSDLQPWRGGSASLRGARAADMRAQDWRRDVLYVHQSKSALLGCPRDLVASVQRFKSRAGLAPLGLEPLLEEFGLCPAREYLDKPWGKLSGGESQRAMLAIGLAARIGSHSQPDLLFPRAPGGQRLAEPDRLPAVGVGAWSSAAGLVLLAENCHPAPDAIEDCGHDGITEAECQEKGCCYDDTSSIWCSRAATSEGGRGERNQGPGLGFHDLSFDCDPLAPTAQSKGEKTGRSPLWTPGPIPEAVADLSDAGSPMLAWAILRIQQDNELLSDRLKTMTDAVKACVVDAKIVAPTVVVQKNAECLHLELGQYARAQRPRYLGLPMPREDIELASLGAYNKRISATEGEVAELTRRVATSEAEQLRHRQAIDEINRALALAEASFPVVDLAAEAAFEYDSAVFPVSCSDLQEGLLTFEGASIAKLEIGASASAQATVEWHRPLAMAKGIDRSAVDERPDAADVFDRAVAAEAPHGNPSISGASFEGPSTTIAVDPIINDVQGIPSILQPRQMPSGPRQRKRLDDIFYDRPELDDFDQWLAWCAPSTLAQFSPRDCEYEFEGTDNDAYGAVRRPYAEDIVALRGRPDALPEQT